MFNDITGENVKIKTIRQSILFKASPHDVYEALMDSRRHAAFTESKARISRKVGGKISAYDGYIDGKNLQLVKDKKIVQSWHSSEWPDGHYSTAVFSLKKVKGGTRLTFVQTGVPIEHYNAINKGWHEHYWERMKKMFEK